jgi:hypothetical protein
MPTTTHALTGLPLILPFLAGLASLAGCEKRAPPNLRAQEIAADLAKAGVVVKPDDPQTCASCHPVIVAEWQESMHSRAHHDLDPLYGGMRSFRMSKEGPGLAEKCGNCHNPRDVAAPDSPVAHTGVSCATCHNLAEVHPDKANPGAKALVRGPEGMLRGVHDLLPGASPVHGTGPALPALADGRTICLACHGQESNKAGVKTCETGLEMEKAHDMRSCTSCHMPEIAAPNGPVSPRSTHRSHAFVGPHRAYLQKDLGILRDAVSLAGRFDGERAVFTLENKSAHAFPTGFPARMATLVVRGLDASGAEVFRNIREEPMKDHPEAVLNKVYHDAEGKPALAPYGVKLARDSRLGPAEKREIAVAVPAAVVKVEATLKLWLIAGQAAKTLGVAALPEARPVDVVSTSAARAP